MSNTKQIEKRNSSIRKVCFLGSKHVADLCGHLVAVDARGQMSLLEHVMRVSLRFNAEKCELEKIKLDFAQYRQSMVIDAEEISNRVLIEMMAISAGMASDGIVDDYAVELSGLTREKFEEIWNHKTMQGVPCSKIVEKRRAYMTSAIVAALRDVEKFTDLPKIAKAARRACIAEMMADFGNIFISDTKDLLKAEAKKARAAGKTR